jgi:hypothetical protein
MLALAWVALAPAAVSADALKDTGREVVRRYGGAVVKIKFVLSTHLVFQGKEIPQPDREEFTYGTIVDPSGLTVAPASQIDQLSNMVNSEEPMRTPDGQKYEFKMKSKLENLSLVLSDGNTLPARIVLKDSDLDLVVLRPRHASGPLPAVPINDEAKAPELLDDVIILSPATPEDAQPCTVNVSRVSSLVQKPRPLFKCNGFVGCPVFDAQGKLLGINVAGKKQSSGFFIWTPPVTLPAAAIREACQQAATVKNGDTH